VRRGDRLGPHTARQGPVFPALRPESGIAVQCLEAWPLALENADYLPVLRPSAVLPLLTSPGRKTLFNTSSTTESRTGSITVTRRRTLRREIADIGATVKRASKSSMEGTLRHPAGICYDGVIEHP
jgi:hypothetical protein